MERKKFDVILLIAGASTRSQLEYNKNFHLINNKPIFAYSLELFLSVDECEKVVIVYKEDELDIVKRFILKYPTDRILLTKGGLTRQESVLNGLALLKGELIMIHDGARPLITREDIKNIYHELLNGNICCLGYKAKDTIKMANNKSYTTLDRENLYLVSTPQGVKKSIFSECLNKAIKDNWTGYDDVSVIEKYTSLPLKIVPSSSYNLKATTLEDIKVISMILGERNV